jgi:hypothetical protein
MVTRYVNEILGHGIELLDKLTRHVKKFVKN